MRTLQIVDSQPFGVEAGSSTRRFLALVVWGGLATVLSASIAGTSIMNVIKSAESAQGLAGTTWLLLLVVAPLTWGLYAALPFLALRSSARGGLWGRIILTLVTGYNVTTLFQPGSLLYLGANLLCVVAFCVATVIAWTLPRTLSGVRSERRYSSVRIRSARNSLILFAVAGLFGFHSVYLRRGWQCLLYILLLGLAFIAAGTAFCPLFIAVISVMLFVDLITMDASVARLNARVLGA